MPFREAGTPGLLGDYRKPSGKALVIHARDEPPFLLGEWGWVKKERLLSRACSLKRLTARKHSAILGINVLL
jgi:hypothetical protein